MNIITDLKQMFKTPTHLQAAATELAAAEHELLKAETGVEYATSLVTFNEKRVKRLKAYLVEQSRGKAK